MLDCCNLRDLSAFFYCLLGLHVQLSLSDNLTNNLTNSARREAVLQAKQVAALYSQVMQIMPTNAIY